MARLPKRKRYEANVERPMDLAFVVFRLIFCGIATSAEHLIEPVSRQMDIVIQLSQPGLRALGMIRARRT